MEFGMMYAGGGPWASLEGAKVMAHTAEEAGVDALWTSDHAVLLADDFADLYKSKGGEWSVPSDYPIMDPMVWLAYVAAITTKLTLATGVLILPIRPAVTLANQVASLDVLSEGRVILGVGSGWLPEELNACGARFEDRMAMLEEGIEVMRTLWTEPVASYQGRFTSFERLVLEPRPVRGTVPIVLGGRVDAAARRAGRMGDGYFPHLRDQERLQHLFDLARRSAEEADRDPAKLKLIAGGARTPEELEGLATMGVEHVIFSPRADSPGKLADSIEQYQRTVIRPVYG